MTSPINKLIFLFIGSQFVDITNLDKSLLEKIPDTLSKKYKIPKEESVVILEEWKLENPLIMTYLDNKDIFLKEAQAYDKALKLKHIKPNTDLMCKLTKWINEIDYKKDEQSFIRYARRCFIFEYIAYTYINILEEK